MNHRILMVGIRITKKYFYTESSPDHGVSPHSEQAMATFDANKQLGLPI